jgi:hypothetical protein
MEPKGLITKRFEELEQDMTGIHLHHDRLGHSVDRETFQQWVNSALNLLQRAFGEDSVHFKNLSKIYNEFHSYPKELENARGVFKAAKSDYLGGYMFELETAISGEIFGDFVTLAKKAMADGYKDVAAVLSCAALEDALKRYAARHNLGVNDKVMQEVVSALKSQGLVSGAQKTLLDTMPKIRDYAMHANWSKIQREDVSSVIGFVEQFLITKFSE